MEPIAAHITANIKPEEKKKSSKLSLLRIHMKNFLAGTNKQKKSSKHCILRISRAALFDLTRKIAHVTVRVKPGVNQQAKKFFKTLLLSGNS